MKRSWVLLSLLLAGCATTRFIPPSIPMKDFVDGRNFIVSEDYAWHPGTSGQAIAVPKGFVTDYASIPPALHSFFRQMGRFNRAAVIHDYLYWSQSCTKEQADNLMMIAMKELGVKKRKRRAIYEAVSRFGRGAWNTNRRELEEGWPKLIPANRFDLANTMTWREARTALRNDGVRDGPFPKNPAFCALGDSQDVPATASD